MAQPPPLPPDRRKPDADASDASAPPAGRTPRRRRRRGLVPLIVVGALLLVAGVIVLADHLHQERRFRRAMQMVDRGDFARAEAYLAMRARQEPENADIRFALGRVYVGRQQWSLAAEQFEAVVALESGHAAARRELGRAYQALGDLTRAAPQLERAVELAPQDGPTWYLLALVRQQERRPIEAESALHQAVACGPDGGHVQALLGRVLHDQGRSDEGLAVLDAALLDHPRSAAVPFQLGEVHRQRGGYGIAADSYRAARDLGMETLACDLGHAEALHRSGSRAEALRLLERLTRTHERAPEPWYQLGLVREDEGDSDGALVCYERCLSLAHDHAEARERAVTLRRTAGR